MLVLTLPFKCVFRIEFMVVGRWRDDSFASASIAGRIHRERRHHHFVSQIRTLQSLFLWRFLSPLLQLIPSTQRRLRSSKTFWLAWMHTIRNSFEQEPANWPLRTINASNWPSFTSFSYSQLIVISSGAASSDRVEVSREDWSFFRCCSSLTSTWQFVYHFIVASSADEAQAAFLQAATLPVLCSGVQRPSDWHGCISKLVRLDAGSVAANRKTVRSTGRSQQLWGVAGAERSISEDWFVQWEKLDAFCVVWRLNA